MRFDGGTMLSRTSESLLGSLMTRAVLVSHCFARALLKVQLQAQAVAEFAPLGRLR
jgi:hypothetical protein